MKILDVVMGQDIQGKPVLEKATLEFNGIDLWFFQHFNLALKKYLEENKKEV